MIRTIVNTVVTYYMTSEAEVCTAVVFMGVY